MEKAKSKHVGIWIRVSTEDQAHGESPEHHERRAQFYAEGVESQRGLPPRSGQREITSRTVPNVAAPPFSQPASLISRVRL
jgi:hypothetical protein